MNLYEIDRALEALIDPETGEIADWAALDALQMEREAKIENVACWYKNLTAEAKAIRQEELALAERRHKLESMAEARKGWLERALQGEKFQTARCAISWRKTTRAELLAPALVIDWAEQHGHTDMVTYMAPEINKTELTRILKAEAVPGAELVEGLSMGVK